MDGGDNFSSSHEKIAHVMILKMPFWINLVCMISFMMQACVSLQENSLILCQICYIEMPTLRVVCSVIALCER